jgi:hypothetical protein
MIDDDDPKQNTPELCSTFDCVNDTPDSDSTIIDANLKAIEDQILGIKKRADGEQRDPGSEGDGSPIDEDALEDAVETAALREFLAVLHALSFFQHEIQYKFKEPVPESLVARMLMTLLRDLKYSDCMVDAIFDESGCTYIVTSDGRIGKTYGNSEVGDTVVLAIGGQIPLLVRTKGSHYELVSPVDMYALPIDVWPDPGRSETLERFTLI